MLERCLDNWYVGEDTKRLFVLEMFLACLFWGEHIVEGCVQLSSAVSCTGTVHDKGFERLRDRRRAFMHRCSAAVGSLATGL